MQSDPIQVLQKFADHIHKSVTACNIGNANAGLVGSCEPFFRILRFSRQNKKIRLMANSTWIRMGVSGHFSVEPISINREDNIFLLQEKTGELTVDDIAYPIFTAHGFLTDGQKELLQSSHLLGVIRCGKMIHPESLHANKGEMEVYLLGPALDRLSTWVNGLFQLASTMEKPTTKKEIEYEKLPLQFHPLIPLIKNWGISDDLEREQVIENASSRVLAALISEVEPYIDAIDSYISSFKSGHPSEAACALGRLAECAIEAKHALARR